MSSWFVHPAFIWLGGLTAVPLLIHFLFRMRPPVVNWPAMEFLRLALKKTRRRSRLEQILLLALRMLIVGVVTLLIARPLVGEELTTLLESGPAAEHVVVLDDTLSMGEIADGEPVFAAAKRSVIKLIERFAERSGRNRLAIIPAAHPTGSIIPPGVVDQQNADAVRRAMESADPSALGRSPDAAVERAVELLLSSEAALRVLHVIGDLRNRDWPADGPSFKAIRRAMQAGIHVRLVDAAPERRTNQSKNLGIEFLSTGSAPAAVGVPLQLIAVILNHSDSPAENVSVEWNLNGKPSPRTIVKSIPSRGRALVESSIVPREPTIHSVSAKLPTDALPGDDERFLAINVVDQVPVLIIDGDERQREGRFLAAALDPGGNARTGWAPSIRSIEALRQTGLTRYGAVITAGIAEFSTDDAKALLRYVASGGSILSFVGDSTTPSGWSSLANAGLLPALLSRSESLNRSSAASGPDLSVVGSALHGLAKNRGTFLDEVSIGRRFAVNQPLPEGAEVFLKSRDGAPLGIVRNVGKGKSAIILTSAGPTWNDWSTNPSFVVFLLEMCSYLARRGDESLIVGDRWTMTVDPTQYRRAGTWTRPREGRKDEQPLTIEIVADGAKATSPIVEIPGNHRASIVLHSGEIESHGVSFNVDPAEGDLRKAPRTAFSGMDGPLFRLESVDDEGTDGPSRRSEFHDFLVMLLAAMVVVELAWARRCSRTAK